MTPKETTTYLTSLINYNATTFKKLGPNDVLDLNAVTVFFEQQLNINKFYKLSEQQQQQTILFLKYDDVKQTIKTALKELTQLEEIKHVGIQRIQREEEKRGRKKEEEKKNLKDLTSEYLTYLVEKELLHDKKGFQMSAPLNQFIAKIKIGGVTLDYATVKEFIESAQLIGNDEERIHTLGIFINCIKSYGTISSCDDYAGTIHSALIELKLIDTDKHEKAMLLDDEEEEHAKPYLDTGLTNKDEILEFIDKYKDNILEFIDEYKGNVISDNPSSQIYFIHILAICQFMLIPEKYKIYLDKNPDSINIDKEFLFEILTNYHEGETYFYHICCFHHNLNIDIFNDFFTIILSYLNTLIITSSIDIPLDAINWDAINWDALAQNPDALKAEFKKRYGQDVLYKAAPEEQNQASSGPNQNPSNERNPFKKIILLDIKHYQEFLNQQILSNLPNLYVSDDRDFLNKFVNKFKISPDSSFKSIDPIPPHGPPHGPPRGPPPIPSRDPPPIPSRDPPFNLDYLRNQENYKCKYAFTHYIDKLIQKKNYPGVYLLLLLYIQMFYSSYNNIQIILQEIQIQIQNINVELFYTTYKTLLEVAPISMDNISNFLAISGDPEELRQKAARMKQKDEGQDQKDEGQGNKSKRSRDTATGTDLNKLDKLGRIKNLLTNVINSDIKNIDQKDVNVELKTIAEVVQESPEEKAQREAEAREANAIFTKRIKDKLVLPPDDTDPDFDSDAPQPTAAEIEAAKVAAKKKRKAAKKKRKAADVPPQKEIKAADADVPPPKKTEADRLRAAAEADRLRAAAEAEAYDAGPSQGDPDLDLDLGGGSANNNKKGGQVGGKCKFDIQQLNQMHVIKMLIEASHDLKGERSDKSVYNGQTISAAKIDNNGTAKNLYEKMYAVLNEFVTTLALDIHANNYEYHFLDDLKGKITNGTKVDENKYLHSIVEILTVDCLDVVDNFFFYNSIHFSLRDLANNDVSYQMLKQKIITTYPPPDWWLVADVNTYSKLGVKYSDLYLYVIKKEDRPDIETTFKLYEQDMGLGDISDIAFREIDYIAAYKTLFPDGSTNDIDVFFEGGAPNQSVDFILNNAYIIATMAAKEKNKTGEIKVVNSEIEITSVWAIDIAKQFDPLSVENPPYGQIFNGPIEQGQDIKSIIGFNKMYIGYPVSLPIDRAGNPGPDPTSFDFFNQQVDNLGPDVAVNVAPEIKQFLKDLNSAAFEATLFAFNTLLNFWIDEGVVDILKNKKTDIVDNYNLILENGNIIGFKFTSLEVPKFTFTAHIADCTVTNICYAMIKCANEWTAIRNAILADPVLIFPPENTPENRIIQQMINIMNHPNYKYPAHKDLDYALTIIATIKSFGDESQLLSKTMLQAFLDSYVRLNKSSKNLFLKTSDRPLVGHLLLYLQSFIAELLVPHRSFGNQEEITDKIPTVFNPKTSKDVTIYNVNASIISNAANVISVVKSTRERLLEIPAEYQAAYNLLQAKLPDLEPSSSSASSSVSSSSAAAASSSSVSSSSSSVSSSSSSVSSSSPNFLDKLKEINDYISNFETVEARARARAVEARARAVEARARAVEASVMDTNNFSTVTDQEAAEAAAAEAEAIAEAAAAAEEAANVTQLKKFRDYIGEIKQILISLEYYNDEHIPDASNVKAMPGKQLLKTITEEYLDLQIKTAVSKSIPSIILTDITVFNNKHGINKIKDITDALSNMYNNLDFYSRIFDLHDIACELFIEKLQMYISIIRKSSLNDVIKHLIIEHYNLLIKKVTDINIKFVEDAKTKLEQNIENREKQGSRGRSNKSTSSTVQPEEGASAADFQKHKTAKDIEATEAQKKADKLKSDILAAKNVWNTAELQLVNAKAELLAAEADVANAKKEIKDAKKDPLKKGAAEQKLTNAEQTKTDANQKKKDAEADEKAKKSELKVLEKQETSNNSVIADIIKTANSLAQKINVATLKAASSTHSMATDVAKNIRDLFGRGRFALPKGGKRSIQNKQRYQKKYTKRIQKKMYRKKTQKRFKIKRPKRTKKHRG